MLRTLPALLVALAVVAWSNDASAKCRIINCMTEQNGGPLIEGSDTMKTETRTVPPFTAVRLTFSGDVVIEGSADAPTLTVTGDDNLLPYILSEVQDGTLVLSLAKGNSYHGKLPVYRIAMSGLKKIELMGSGDIDASKLDGDTLSVSDTGSGDVTLAGEIGELTVTVGGSGDVDAHKLKAKRATIAVNGSGDVSVNASEQLDAKIHGSGDITYAGSPKVVSEIHGSGSIDRK